MPGGFGGFLGGLTSTLESVGGIAEQLAGFRESIGSLTASSQVPFVPSQGSQSSGAFSAGPFLPQFLPPGVFGPPAVGQLPQFEGGFELGGGVAGAPSASGGGLVLVAGAALLALVVLKRK